MWPGRTLRDALRNLSLKGLSLGLERGGRLLVAIVAATVLGQATFGRYVFASTVTAMLALGTDLGLGIWTTRALARGRSNDQDVVRLGLGLRALTSLPYAIAVLATARLSEGGEPRTVIACLGGAALFNAFADHFGAILRGYERFVAETRLNATRAVVTTACGLAALGVGRSLGALAAALAAASLGGFAYGLVTMLRIHPPASRAAGPAGPRVRARAALRQSLPIWLSGLVSLLYFKVDTLFLHAMAGDAELGIYGAAYKLFEGALLLPVVLLSVTFPRLARAHDDPPVQRQLERQLAAILLVLGLGVGATLFFGRALLVETLFGRAFRRAEPSLAVLALGLPVLYLNSGLTHFLVARNMERVTTWLSLMMLALNIALDVVLIPGGRGPGAAWATLLSELALTVGCVGTLRAESLRRTPPSTPAASRTDRRAA